MKIRQLLIIITLTTLCFIVQAQDKKVDTVSFVVKIDIKQATKDGIYLNGYVVNIPYRKMHKLNGKKVLISGKVTILKGLKQYNDGKVRQGREDDTKHILNPKIKLVSD